MFNYLTIGSLVRRVRNVGPTFCLVGMASFQPLVAGPKPLVLFVPGYYGTELVHAETKETIWVSVSELLFGGRRLNLCQQRIRPLACLPLVAGRMLEQVDVVPWVYSVDIYGKAYTSLKELVGAKFDLAYFSYDWRLDPVILASALIQRIRQERRSVYIVAHSYGGLVTANLLRVARRRGYRLRHLKGISLIGVPFLGAASAMSNLIAGRQTQFSETLLDAVAYGTFPSAYHMVPRGNKLIVNGQGRDISHLVVKPEAWKKNKWGAYGEGGIETAPALAFIKAQFIRRRNMDRAFEAKRAFSVEAAILNFRSRSRRVRSTLVWDSAENRLLPTKKGEYYDRGDGTVPWRSAKLPAGLTPLLAKSIELQGEHLEMLTEPKFLQSLREHLDETLTP